MAITHINGEMLIRMLRGGAASLAEHTKEINDLNVFPIPDGDTGDNMSMTINGGANTHVSPNYSIGQTAEKIAGAMLLSARGNSGVILSQFCAGIADGFKGHEIADLEILKEACRMGVERAYQSVMTPTEGTILTVAKDATRYACSRDCSTIEEFITEFIIEAKAALERTPTQLAVLSQAGVVDSGGAGLVYIAEGVYRGLTGEDIGELTPTSAPGPAAVIDPDLFTEDTVLEFGYCTELLIRLQNAKTDIASFNTTMITDYLQSIGGDSIVCFMTGSIVKLHVHTMTPGKVLEHCQKFGEFLTLKIENMMLQHSEAEKSDSFLNPKTTSERIRYAIVTVAQGDGIRDAFLDFGVNEVISGGQTMNPSSERFIQAFDRVNAETIFVLPNNGNIIMAAQQAAKLYTDSDVRVIPTKNIGDAFAILSMLNLDSGTADEIESEMHDAMLGVETAEISRSIRDTEMNSLEIKKDDYIGILGKEILVSDSDRLKAVGETLKHMHLNDHTLVLIIRGAGTTPNDFLAIEDFMKKEFPMIEVYDIEGRQDIYEFILVAE